MKRFLVLFTVMFSFVCIFPMTKKKSANVKLVMDIMKKAGDSDYIGEGVSQLEHGLQAADLARAARKDVETIVAALLHDIGHQLPGEAMPGLGKKNHAEQGALFLEALGFKNKTVELVRGHVQAKRYLVYAEQYKERLSIASKQTLQLQGGAMTQKEAQAFRIDPLFEDKIELRYWDEAAKDPNGQSLPLEVYELMIRDCIT